MGINSIHYRIDQYLDIAPVWYRYISHMCVFANLECFRVQQQVVVAFSGSNQPNKAEEKADDDEVVMLCCMRNAPSSAVVELGHKCM